MTLFVDGAEECVGEEGAEGVDAVCVRFAMRIGEVAEEDRCGACNGVRYDACPCEARFAECPCRGGGPHELAVRKFPAEGCAGVYAFWKCVVACQVEDARRSNSLAVEGSVV